MKRTECPRCAGSDVTAIGTSPIEGVWELYRCGICQYVWRSTEGKEMLTTIKLTQEEMNEIPPVPPLGLKE